MQHADNWPTRIRWQPSKVSLTILLILATYFNGFAQDSLMRLFPIHEIPKSEEILDFTLSSNNTPILISRFGETMILHDLTSDDTGTPLFIRQNEQTSLVAHELEKDRLTLLEKSGIGDDKAFILRRLNLKGNSVEEEMNHSFRLERRRTSGPKTRPILTVSDDNKVVAVCQQAGFNRSAKAEFNVFLVDSLGPRRFHLPSEYDSDDVQLLGATVSENSLVYLGVIAGVKLNSPFRKRYLIYSFNPADSVLTEFDLSSQDLFIRDVVIRSSEDGLRVAALYNADPLDEDHSTGYIYLKLTADGKEIEKRIVSTFDLSFVRSHVGPEITEVEPVKFIYVVDILTIGDKSVLAIEKQYQDQLCTADPRTGMLNCTDQFHFDGITLIDAVGQRAFLHMGRRQIDYDRRSLFSSHAIQSLEDGGVMFLYNDHFKNTGLGPGKAMNNPNRSELRSVTIGTSGQHVTKQITRDRQAGGVFSPLFGIARYDGMLYYPAINGRSLRAIGVILSKL